MVSPWVSLQAPGFTAVSSIAAISETGVKRCSCCRLQSKDTANLNENENLLCGKHR
jgi:hypothetical protein